jgi:hypothetical protein
MTGYFRRTLSRCTRGLRLFFLYFANLGWDEHGMAVQLAAFIATLGGVLYCSRVGTLALHPGSTDRRAVRDLCWAVSPMARVCCYPFGWIYPPAESSDIYGLLVSWFLHKQIPS